MMGMVMGFAVSGFVGWQLARTLRTKVRIDPEMNTQAKYEKKRCRCESESVPKAVKKRSITTSICILSYG